LGKNVATIQTFTDTVTTQLNTEVEVVSITGDVAPYAIVEGYIDLSQIPDDATVIIREYVGIGSTPVLFLQTTVDATLAEKIIRFHSKALPNGGSYKVTIEQTAGTTFSVQYWFAKTGLT